MSSELTRGILPGGDWRQGPVQGHLARRGAARGDLYSERGLAVTALNNNTFLSKQNNRKYGQFSLDREGHTSLSCTVWMSLACWDETHDMTVFML